MQALKRYPQMGFDIAKHEAIIYDEGTEAFTGTTLKGIGQSVVGVLQNPLETANRFVPIMSIKTSQNELLAAFENATDKKWKVQRSTTKELLERGQQKMKNGQGTLELAIVQLLDPGKGRCVVAKDFESSFSRLAGVKKLSAEELVNIVLRAS